MLHRGTIVICFEIRTKHIKSIMWRKEREFMNVKTGGT
jgi:hypothetical protein